MASQSLNYLKGSNRNFDNILDSYLNLTDGGTVAGTTTFSGTTLFTGAAVGGDIMPSLSGLTATVQNTSGTTTGVVETLHI